jgi:hypothetical protein
MAYLSSCIAEKLELIRTEISHKTIPNQKLDASSKKKGTDLHVGAAGVAAVDLDLVLRQGVLAHQPLGLLLFDGRALVVGEGAHAELDRVVAAELLLLLPQVTTLLRLPRQRFPPAAVIGCAPRRPVPFLVLADPRRQEVRGVPLTLVLVLLCDG